MRVENNGQPFKDKVIWITGASSGIGEELSYQLAAQGAAIILSARRKARLEEVQAEVLRRGGQAAVLPFDLEELEHLPGIVEEAISIYGQVDMLINNAALAVRDYTAKTVLEVDRRLMRVNYFGPITLSKALLPHFVKRGEGQFVVMSSLAGKFGVPRTAAYTASKHALHGFFETLRSELDPVHFPITMIVAGIINTEITAHALKGDGSPFGRVEKTYRTGYPVNKAARKIIKSIRKRKEEVFVGGFEGVTLWINWLSPYLLRRMIRSHPVKWARRMKKRFSFGKKSAA